MTWGADRLGCCSPPPSSPSSFSCSSAGILSRGDILRITEPPIPLFPIPLPPPNFLIKACKRGWMGEGGGGGHLQQPVCCCPAKVVLLLPTEQLKLKNNTFISKRELSKIQNGSGLGFARAMLLKGTILKQCCHLLFRLCYTSENKESKRNLVIQNH